MHAISQRSSSGLGRTITHARHACGKLRGARKLGPLQMLAAVPAAQAADPLPRAASCTRACAGADTKRRSSNRCRRSRQQARPRSGQARPRDPWRAVQARRAAIVQSIRGLQACHASSSRRRGGGLSRLSPPYVRTMRRSVYAPSMITRPSEVSTYGPQRTTVWSDYAKKNPKQCDL